MYLLMKHLATACVRHCTYILLYSVIPILILGQDDNIHLRLKAMCFTLPVISTSTVNAFIWMTNYKVILEVDVIFCHPLNAFMGT